MSKTPLQLYVNDRYNETVSGYVNKEWYRQQKKSRKHRSDTFNGRQPTFRQLLHSYTNSDLCFGSQTIFKNYLREHKKSIEDYYNLQKQQKEILRLCKAKIAKKFPAQLAANLADEDVIRALKIAQNSESSQLEKCCSSDQVVDAILKFITSNQEQQKLKKKRKSSGPVKTKSYETRILPQNTTKRNSAFKRFIGVFRKSKAPPSIKEERDYIAFTKKEEHNAWSCPQVKKRDASGSDSAIESDSSVSPNGSKTKVSPIIDPPPKSKHRNHTPKIIAAHQTTTVETKCRCHSKVKKITHDIKRQENQIREIQSNLRHCLAILKRIEHPQAKFEPEPKISEKPPIPNCDLIKPGRIEYHYRADNVTFKPPGTNRNHRKPDASADEVKKVCCYKCKRKRKTTDQTVSAAPDKLTAGTSTSQGAVAKSKTLTIQPPTTTQTTITTTVQPTTIPQTNEKIGVETTEGTSLVSTFDEEEEADEHRRPLTRKERRMQKKKKKKELKMEKKRQKQLAKAQQKKRCCLIRLIKFVCCSGCCT